VPRGPSATARDYRRHSLARLRVLQSCGVGEGVPVPRLPGSAQTRTAPGRSSPWQQQHCDGHDRSQGAQSGIGLTKGEAVGIEVGHISFAWSLGPYWLNTRLPCTVMQFDLTDEESSALRENCLPTRSKRIAIRCRAASKPCGAFWRSSARWHLRHHRRPANTGGADPSRAPRSRSRRAGSQPRHQ
jgi:hypothetical protein